MARGAFDDGVEPGGLRDVNDIKILICYLLKHTARQMTFDNLNEILQHDGLCNYFDFANALQELLETGHVDLAERDETKYYRVTRLGAGTADLFERRLPYSVREKAVKAAIRLLARLRLEAENKVTITQTKSGFVVECRVLDGSDELLAVRLLLPEREQAETVKRQFLSDPAKIYQGALALMTGDVNSVGGLIAPENPGKTDGSIG